MSGIAAPNLNTNLASAAAITARNAEYTDTPFTDLPGDGTFDDPYLGMNRAGSCAPGVGINTGDLTLDAAQVAAGDERFESWTELDQRAQARIPQQGQLIGGVDASMDPADNGSPVQPEPPNIDLGVVPFTTTAGADLNDTLNLVITDTAAADGAVMDTVSGAINDTGETVGVGDLIWGKVPVA